VNRKVIWGFVAAATPAHAATFGLEGERGARLLLKLNR
jgi:hypothetical protein